MARLKQTLLLLFLCSACFTTATAAYARQGKVTPLFPASLNEAIDNSTRNAGAPAPWRIAQDRYVPTPARQQTAGQVEPNDEPEPAENTDAAETKATQEAKSVVMRRSPRISGTYSEPSLPKPDYHTSNDEMRNQPDPIHSDPTSSTIDQPEFGTVMTFPAQAFEQTVPRREAGIYQPPRRLRPSQDLPKRDLPPSEGSSSQPDGVFKFASTKLPPKDAAGSPTGESEAPSAEPSGSTDSGSKLTDAPSNQVLLTSIIGPDLMVRNVPDKFDIVVTNTLEHPATNIVVQILVPEDLTITELDRHAWMDTEYRTITWKLNQLAGGEKEVIRYSAVSSMPGRHRQQVKVGMENSYQGQTHFEINVVANESGDNARRPRFETNSQD